MGYVTFVKMRPKNNLIVNALHQMLVNVFAMEIIAMNVLIIILMNAVFAMAMVLIQTRMDYATILI